MTYKELADFLATLSQEQLEMEVTILDADREEFYPAHSVNTIKEPDILVENHPYIKY